MEYDRIFWNNITELGNNGVLLALTMAAAAYLAWSGARKAALVVVASFIVTASGIAVMKIIVFGCNPEITSMIKSPSGHAAMAAAVWGTLAVVGGGAMKGIWRCLPLLAAAALVATVAVSRIALEYHTVQETVIGLIFGSIVAAAAAAVLHRETIPVKPEKLVLTLLLAGLASCGLQFHAEELLREVGGLLEIDITFCKTLGIM